jgi:hypothetical protein
MSRLIESLENRMLMSVTVTAAVLNTDAKALVTAAAQNTVELNALLKSQAALTKAVSATVKADGAAGDKAANAKLLAALSKEFSSSYGKLKAADKALTVLAKSSATSGNSSGKALIAKPTNAALLAKVAKIITALDTTIPTKANAITAAETNVGSSTDTTFTTLSTNVPSLVNAIQSALADGDTKATAFDGGVSLIVSASAQLGADLGGAPVITPVTLTGATLFRGDATGQNLNTAGSAIAFGGWTTGLDVQNVPGNYAAELFISTTPTPSASDFLTPGTLAKSLAAGDNVFYFFADGDDTRGGANTFGLNLFLNSAGPNSPTISGYTIPGTGQTLVADSASVTSGATLVVVPGAGTLTVPNGSGSATLSNFQVLGVSGQGSGVDLVNSTNTAPFTPPPQPDGVFDTWGTFTITVTA